jgi:hypothetical protein
MKIRENPYYPCPSVSYEGEARVIPIAFVSVSAYRPDVNVRAHPAKSFGLFLAPEGGFAD